ncbi:D-galactarate dehydratase [Boseongicola sp. H5]|uniref:D-galactarate dehydratase n=1 Tax=Rhodobacterales TaxID=204455 RepID=UPI001D0A82B1|nr:D-galactarate dehydratase [Boseongicola sp. H5]
MTKWIAPVLVMFALTGCAQGLGLFRGGDAGPSAARSPDGETPRPMERPSAEEGLAPDDGPQPVRDAGGETIASLGDPSEPGLWLRTPLVSTERQGRITTESGASVTLRLIPIAGATGAGSRISLEAMRALGVPLTDLVPLTVSLG